MADQNIQSSRLDRRFDTLRNKVEQQANAANQQSQEALARKGAATGAGQSGAFMKLGEKVRQEGEAAKGNALMAVEGEREGAQFQLDEANTNRAFATSEREAGQKFSQGMAREQMGFARQERIGSQTFQSGEAAAQRGFSKQLFDKEMQFKNRVQSSAEGQFLQNLSRVDRQFFEDQRISNFNMDMANKQFNKKDLMENMESIAPFSVTKIANGGGGGIGSTIRRF